jgi:NAD(P)-dependent dehydrogenase (short-subunit alcohol dehydrogenase family)
MDRRTKGLIVVTGASGGIGRATVELFSARGWQTVAIDKRPPDLSVDAGSEVNWVQADLSVESEAAAAFRLAIGDSPVQHVLAIAGGAVPEERLAGRWSLPTVSGFRASLDTNLLTAYITATALIPALQASSGDRSITFCTSINALAAWSYPAYSASKGALIGLTHMLAAMLAPHGIRCNAVALGSVATQELKLTSAERHALESSIPLGRMATAEDAARAFYAASVEITHFTGQVMVVDGGQEISRWALPS